MYLIISKLRKIRTQVLRNKSLYNSKNLENSLAEMIMNARKTLPLRHKCVSYS